MHCFFDRSLDSRTPAGVMLPQAHLHLWNFDYWNQPEAPTYGFLGHDGTLSAYKSRVEALFGQREVSGLMLPFPIKGLDSETAMSTWAAEQCRSHSGSGWFAPSLLITPATTYDEIVDGVKRFGFVNLKPYHVYSIGENRVPSTGKPSDNTAYAEIEDFLTDDHCRAAHDCGLGITLHMVKPRALAERSNQIAIRKYCETYPNMKMILAHCARGFNMCANAVTTAQFNMSVVP